MTQDVTTSNVLLLTRWHPTFGPFMKKMCNFFLFFFHRKINSHIFFSVYGKLVFPSWLPPTRTSYFFAWGGGGNTTSVVCFSSPKATGKSLAAPVVGHVTLDELSRFQGRHEGELAGQDGGTDHAGQLPGVLARLVRPAALDSEHLRTNNLDGWID